MRAQPAVHEIGQGSLNTLIQSLTHSSLLLEQAWSLQQPPLVLNLSPGSCPQQLNPIQGPLILLESLLKHIRLLLKA